MTTKNRQLNRRDLLGLFAGAAAGTMAGGCRLWNGGGSRLRLACQMWSVDKLWRKDFPGTIARMRALGYEGVQSKAFWTWNRKELVNVLGDNGMEIVDMPIDREHLSSGRLASTVEFCQEFGVDFLFIPWFKPKEPDGWKRLADDMVAGAANLRRFGIRVGYHNHQHEFRERFNGMSVMDYLFRRPELDFELDVGHAKLAGADPVDVLGRLAGRVPSIHAKPGGGDSVGGAGDANNWPAILAACRAMGTKWAVVECETRRDTFADIEASAAFLKNL